MARCSSYQFETEDEANIVFALLCSSLGYWWWAVASDGFNLKKWLLDRFPVSTQSIDNSYRSELAQLGASLNEVLKQNYVFKDNKGHIGNYYLPACEVEIQAIDDLLSIAVPDLSSEFFRSIREFNSAFSRAQIEL